MWLDEQDAFVLIAHTDGGPIGYALVHMRGPEETWATGELSRIGVAHLGVSVIASNAAAVRFYERLGLVPFLVSYIRLVEKPEPHRRS